MIYNDIINNNIMLFSSLGIAMSKHVPKEFSINVSYSLCKRKDIICIMKRAIV